MNKIATYSSSATSSRQMNRWKTSKNGRKPSFQLNPSRKMLSKFGKTPKEPILNCQGQIPTWLKVLIFATMSPAGNGTTCKKYYPNRRGSFGLKETENSIFREESYHFSSGLILQLNRQKLQPSKVFLDFRKQLLPNYLISPLVLKVENSKH